ncbi:MAG: hypothetical protein ACYSWU_00140 [Planctomycetota bacterium]
MADYSVWNGKGYDYYRASGELRDGVFAKKPKIRGGGKLGVAPDDAAQPLPMGAVLIGKGLYPRGSIATRKSGNPLAGITLDISNKELLMLGIAGYLLWKYVFSEEAKK